MDINNTIACMAVAPWVWIVTKFLLFPNLYDLLPLAFFCYLYISLYRAFRKERQSVLAKIADDMQIFIDVSTQTTQNFFYDKFSQTQQMQRDVSIQTDEKKKIEKDTQTFELRVDSFTQTAESRKDSFTQTGKTELKEKGIQTVRKSTQEKDAQTFLLEYVCKESQTNICSHSDKESQAEINLQPVKVFLPIRPQRPKPSVPPTKDFLKYHRIRYQVIRKKMKFTPTLRKISEIPERRELKEVVAEAALEMKPTTIPQCITNKLEEIRQTNEPVEFIHQIPDKKEKRTFFKKKFKPFKFFFRK